MATVHDISRHLTYILIKGYIIITSLLRVSFIAEPSTAALSHRMPHPVTAAVANGKKKRSVCTQLYLFVDLRTYINNYFGIRIEIGSYRQIKILAIYNSLKYKISLKSYMLKS
jgi:hypothetical protein